MIVGDPNVNRVVYKTFITTSDQTGLPAELKHINKRRKRN